MTSASLVSPVPVADLGAAVEVLHEHGLRVTGPRRLVLDALLHTDGAVTAEELADQLGSRCDLTSVYRNLETFEGIGLVRHTHLGHGPGRYALAGAPQREHLVCDGCGTHTAVEPERMDGVRAAMREAFGYEARFSHFPLVGLCPACATTTAPGEAHHAHP